jgi:DNA-binding transcriptional regulator PaaX
MSDVDEKPMKALYDHCVTVFDEMFKEAVPEETMQASEVDPVTSTLEPTGYVIWTGHLTQLFARLGMATPYYTSVMQALKKMGCAEQIRRGGGNSMSKWRLVRRPEEDFFTAAEKIKKPTQGSFAALEQQFRDMNSRVTALEDRYHDLVQNLPVMENVE